MPALGVLAATGLVTAVLYLESLSQLWTSWYGRVLVFKVLLFASVGAFGAYNWRRLRPQLGTPSATTALTKSAAIELSLAALVLGITSVLVALPLEP